MDPYSKSVVTKNRHLSVKKFVEMSPKPKIPNKKERPVYMSRTSDDIGTTYHRDVDSNMVLVQQKINEKCGNTRDLIMKIKTFKGTKSHRVSINEFKSILVKFGVLLTPTEIECMFSVFDSDRSGTIDFDEFAMWIISSSYRPKMRDRAGEEKLKIEQLRDLMRREIEKYPQAFSIFEEKGEIDYMEFVSALNRLKMALSEKDIRDTFLILDPSCSGKVKTKSLLHWAKTGALSRPESTMQVFGPGQDLLPPLTPGLLDAKLTHFQKSTFRRPITKAPQSEISVPSSTSSSVLSAERRLRELIKPGFRSIRKALQKEQYTEFIDPEKLHKIVLKYCSPISFTDFRLVLTLLKKDESKSKIDSSYFVAYFDPDKLIPTQLKLVEKRHKKLKPISTLTVGKFCGFPTPRGP